MGDVDSSVSIDGRIVGEANTNVLSRDDEAARVVVTDTDISVGDDDVFAAMGNIDIAGGDDDTPITVCNLDLAVDQYHRIE